MRRREFVRAAVLGGTLALAGCTDDSDDSDDSQSIGDGSTETETPTPEIVTEEGPAAFAALDLSIDSDEIAVREQFSATLRVANVGGEAGDVSGRLRLVPAESAAAEELTGEFQVRGLESGEWEDVSVGPFETGFAGRYEAELRGLDEAREAAATASVDPLRGELGEAVRLTEELRITAEDVSFEDALHYEITESRGFWSSVDRLALQQSLDDETLAVIGVTVENSGTSSRQLSPELVGVSEGQLFTSFGEHGLEAAVVDGDPVLDRTVNPGSAESGWLLAKVPREAAGDLSLVGQLDGPHTPPEVEWSLTDGEPTFPQFELVDVEAPSRSSGPPTTFGFTVRNGGEATGTFRGVIQFREEGEDRWLHWKDVTGRLPAGEEREFSVTSEYSDTNTYEYRLQPFGSTWTTEYE